MFARCGSYLALYSGSCMGMRLTAYVTDACLTLEISCDQMSEDVVQSCNIRLMLG